MVNEFLSLKNKKIILKNALITQDVSSKTIILNSKHNWLKPYVHHKH